jgi:hypothetical protein
MTDCRQRHARNGGALRFVLVNSWILESTTTPPFTAKEDDDLERSTQEQEERRKTTILSDQLKNKRSDAR